MAAPVIEAMAVATTAEYEPLTYERRFVVTSKPISLRLVFAEDVDKEMVVLMVARASRLENQDAIDAAIVGMLADPKEILNLAWNKSDIQNKVHSIIDKFVERGLRSLGIACQEVPAGTKDSPGGPWDFVALLLLKWSPHSPSYKWDL